MLDTFNEDMVLTAIRELTAEYAALVYRVIKLEGGN